MDIVRPDVGFLKNDVLQLFHSESEKNVNVLIEIDYHLHEYNLYIKTFVL